jgi:hypothetical protein
MLCPPIRPKPGTSAQMVAVNVQFSVSAAAPSTSEMEAP